MGDEYADTFTEQQKKAMKSLFNKYGEDGQLQKGEVMRMLQLLNQNPTNSQLKSAFQELNLNDADSLNYDEFQGVVWNVWNDTQTEQELREAFKKFDKDGNGFLDVDEFKQVMLSYGEAFTLDELTEMMKIVDVNSDQKIDYEEFVRLLTQPQELGLEAGDDEEDGFDGADEDGYVMNNDEAGNPDALADGEQAFNEEGGDAYVEENEGGEESHRGDEHGRHSRNGGGEHGHHGGEHHNKDKDKDRPEGNRRSDDLDY